MDPLAYIDGMNMYSYHSPIVSTDPLGLSISTLDEIILHGLKTNLEIAFALYLLQKGFTTSSFQVTNPLFIAYFQHFFPRSEIDSFYDEVAPLLGELFYSECEVDELWGGRFPLKKWESGRDININRTLLMRLTFHGAESLHVNVHASLKKPKGAVPLKIDFDDEWVWGDTLNLHGKTTTQILPGIRHQSWNRIEDDTIDRLLGLLGNSIGRSWQNPEVTISFPVKEHRSWQP